MKKSARIECLNGKSFWTTQKDFWRWVRQGLVVLTGENPATGRFIGRREHLLVLINHTILDKGSPIHLNAVIESKRNMKPKQRRRVI